jgi:hypothetical protein
MLCPENAIGSIDRTWCECQIGYYGLPFEESWLPVLAELDPDTYSNYIASSGVTVDLNALVGFFCAQCPSGANCSTRNVTVETVRAEAGWFSGIDGTNTSFFQCLNDACDDSGGCKEGYTVRAYMFFVFFSRTFYDYYLFKK